MKIILLTLAFIPFLFSGCNSKSNAPDPAETIVVKVAVVIQDPIMPGTDGKRMHEVVKTPGYTFEWNNPYDLNKEYEKALEEVSHGVVDFEIVEIIEDPLCFSSWNGTNEAISMEEMIELIQEADWKSLKEVGTHFDYKRFVEHYEFDLKRDRGEIHEVWVWSYPYGGMWESNYVGDSGFWLNSEPTTGTKNENLLVVKGLNYERKMSLAMESFGHRFESVMRHVYGRWERNQDHANNWELYTQFDQHAPGEAHIGNIHFPPNGVHDYDWINETVVNTYADGWAWYPDIRLDSIRTVDCTEWDCSHEGYMRWWFSHIPHFEGVNPDDGILNNWWHYVVDWEGAK